MVVGRLRDIVQSSLVATRETLSIPVDYNDVGGGSVGDPPAGMYFGTQQEIDDFLTSKGWTAFKHLELAYNALPPVVAHNVVFSLAAGVHRPIPGATSVGFELINHDLKGVRDTPVFGPIEVRGVPSSQWTQAVASTAVTGVSADTNDPWVDFTGTPFTGLNLVGLYMVGDSGVVSVIHDHTDSRLYCIGLVTPTPTSAFVGRPATILRNASSDVPGAKVGSSGVRIRNVAEYGIGAGFYDLQIDGWGSTYDFRPDFSSDGSWVRLINVLFDHVYQVEQYSASITSSRMIQGSGVFSLWTEHCSMRGRRLASTPASGTYSCAQIITSQRYIPKWCLFGGAQVGIFSSGAGLLNYLRSVSTDHSEACIRLEITQKAFWSDAFYSGAYSRLRNAPKGLVLLQTTCGGNGTRMEFENLTDACIELIGDAVYLPDDSSHVGFLNGAVANTGVGWRFVGVGNEVTVLTGDVVTGSGGDFEFSDGTIVSYADIDADGPYGDHRHNIVSRE